MLMSSCITTRTTARINKVNVGMNKNEITQLLGTPMFRYGNSLGEEWGYRKMIGEVAGPEPVLFLVTFDNNGKVVAYQTIKDHVRY